MSEDVISVQALDASAVSRYLEDNPTFFLEHQQLLAELSLTHESGSATSLLERQVSLLRERNVEIRKRLNDMLEQGQVNDVLFNKTRGLILDLLETENISDLTQNLVNYCQKEFQVDAIQFTLVSSDKSHQSSACQVLSQADIDSVLPTLLTLKKSWSGVFRDDELNMLFANQSQAVTSAIIMPVCHHDKTLGFITLGSQDVNYFQSGMDTVFLSFIADVFAKLLPKYC